MRDTTRIGTPGPVGATDTTAAIPDVHDSLASPAAADAARPAGTTGAQSGEAFVGRPTIRGRRFMISAVHYLATLGGLRVLTRGGNAIDAGVAAGLCINVVQPHYAMFGGVAPIIISPAPRKDGAPAPVVTISGLGRWPRAARLEDYLARYGGDLPGGLPRTATPTSATRISSTCPCKGSSPRSMPR